MPTCIEGNNFAHTCQHCGHKQTERRDKPFPFLFTQYRCIGCSRTLDDLDYELLAEARVTRPPQSLALRRCCSDKGRDEADVA